MMSMQLITAESSMLGRWLQHVDTMTTFDTDTNPAKSRDSSILRDMAVIYGSLFFVAFFLFCLARIVFPRPYTVRRWTDDESLKVCNRPGLRASVLAFVDLTCTLLYRVRIL